ncbi:MAG TPA: hypothetical protein VGS21_08570, partial [Acidimicrobiales bacterium]|nr:hypothetical protein [Acidimicrobiales bacterium]
MPVPTGGAPVGPFPPDIDPSDEGALDAYDRRRRRVLWSFPTGLYVVGSRHGEERNLMTCSLLAQLATTPKLVGVS